jgi:peroxidase
MIEDRCDICILLIIFSQRLYAEDGSLLNTSYTMSDTFNDPSRIVTDKTYFDAVIRGLLTQPSQSVDQNVDDSLWNRLFR